METFSEQQIVDCSSKFGNAGCNGGYSEGALDYFKSVGAATETKYPYKGKDGNCQYNTGMKAATVTGVVHLEDEANMLNAVAINPVATAVYADPFMNYKSGIYNDYNKCKAIWSKLDHEVAVIGYGADDQGNKYWIVKNSWGMSWGERGYIRFARKDSGKGICGIALDVNYPQVSK